ncbi:ABC transporter ATP-binding protein [Clostridiisalibacter paucivorans]|uniref:ABC transporter ATP-binding protein n=1 Tax=Clostridiisalibacter paucivorans TaxID=408753 RepID=UPI00047CD186|nr:ABC transporter ATP-binding protein [Clostridiisalibacter paucivorans]
MEINIKNLNKSYKGVKALKDININMKTPAMIGLVGPNGAGKSTLMKILVGQALPTSGKITVDGKNLYKNFRYLKKRLGYLPQDFGLYDELSVYEFLDYMACLKGITKNRKRRVQLCIEETNLEQKSNAKIKTLSGGQKQRVGIAQAMLNNPELFIVDEPTVGLDPEERIKFRNLFSKGSKDKVVILSTHIIEDVQSICNYLIVLNKGKILFSGIPSELVKKAVGHVGMVEIGNDEDKIIEENFKIISTVVTPEGIKYRIVGEELPNYCTEITPSLEDAYVYCMLKEGALLDE